MYNAEKNIKGKTDSEQREPTWRWNQGIMPYEEAKQEISINAHTQIYTYIYIYTICSIPKHPNVAETCRSCTCAGYMPMSH